MHDTAIKSNRILTPDGFMQGVVLIKQGKIVEVTQELNNGQIPVEDVGELIVMPGIIDPHVHINEPGRTGWEGFDTATKAALAGGITSLVEMPLNASPVTTTVDAFDKKINAAQGKLHVHCGFWGGIIPGNEKEIEPLIKKGVLGFKAFLTHSGIDEFPNVVEDDLRKAMPLIAKYDLPLLVHCEISDNLPRAGGNPRLYQNYLSSRPKQWENDAIALMIRLCEEFNCRTHIVHLSSADAVKEIAKAKEKGLPLTVETAQHYLYFSAEDTGDGQTSFKCAPPIRERENRERLWAALKGGVIDFVATDHSPAPPQMKETDSGDFMKAWGGIASLQFALPVLWTAAKQRECALTDLLKWLCLNPARLAGLHQRKGKIAPGYDADLVIWDPAETFTVTETMIQHKHKLTPYLGQSLSGVVKQTWLNGQKAFGGGKFLNLNKGHILYNEQ